MTKSLDARYILAARAAIGALAVDVGDHQLRPRLRQRARRAQADPASPAGDDRDASRDRGHAISPSPRNASIAVTRALLAAGKPA